MLDRYLTLSIQNDALKKGKMAFISGPRQVGKTSIATQLLSHKENYYSWDDPQFSKIWAKNPEQAINNAQMGPVVFDEIHKYRFWKKSLKGLYDKHKDKFKFIVTGSARLDIYKKGGDSLMGRYFPYRLHPFTVSETKTPPQNINELSEQKINYKVEDLIKLSGFPEPLLAGSQTEAERWARLRKEKLLREDIRDFKNIRELQLMKLLMDMLPDRVGSPLSLNNLREDLQIGYATLREWMEVLKSLYFCFQIPPYSKKIARSLVKESKYYLYDGTDIQEEGPKLENLVALHLLKSCHYWTDIGLGLYELYYLRTREKDEVDFCITQKGIPFMLIECKSNDTAISPSLIKMHRIFPKALAFQLTLKNIDKIDLPTNIRIINIEKFLSFFV